MLVRVERANFEAAYLSLDSVDKHPVKIRSAHIIDHWSPRCVLHNHETFLKRLFELVALPNDILATVGELREGRKGPK